MPADFGARDPHSLAQRMRRGEEGGLFAIDVGVRGRVEHRFA
jgi:hypothetical protein